MFFYLEGALKSKNRGEIIVDNAGYGFRIFLSESSFNKLPKIGSKVKIFTFFYQRENQPAQIFGFLREAELRLFEILNSVSGIGPRTAALILSQSSPEEIVSAIAEKKVDFLKRVSGIGEKMAQRIILELKGKVNLPLALSEGSVLDEDLEVLEALVGLGFSRGEVRAALEKVDKGIKGVEEKLKAALKVLGREKI